MFLKEIVFVWSFQKKEQNPLLSTEIYKKKFMEMLEKLKELGFNVRTLNSKKN